VFTTETVTVGALADVSRIVWVGTTTLRANDLLIARDAEERSARGEACGYLREVLTGGEVDGREVLAGAHALGIAEKTLRRATRELGVVYRREGFGRNTRVYWSLPLVATDSQSWPSRNVTTTGDCGHEWGVNGHQAVPLPAAGEHDQQVGDGACPAPEVCPKCGAFMRRRYDGARTCTRPICAWVIPAPAGDETARDDPPADGAGDESDELACRAPNRCIDCGTPCGTATRCSPCAAAGVRRRA
jgi:hypothetical protein